MQFSLLINNRRCLDSRLLLTGLFFVLAGIGGLASTIPLNLSTPTMLVLSQVPSVEAPMIPKETTESKVSADAQDFSIDAVTKEEMPKRVSLKSEQSFPISNGAGSVTVPVGRQVEVIGLKEEILTVSFLGGQKEVNYKETNFVDEVKAIRAERIKTAAAKKAEEQARIEAEKNRLIEEEKTRPKKELAKFIKTVEAVDHSGALFSSASVDEGRLILTVKSGWHYQPYQIRLQAAQNLWKLWATIHSPNEPDKARLKIRDINGNDVGGSRIWAGSLIWVQE